jgi:N-methylhydantoinase B
MQEATYPLRIESVCLRQDSAGAGRHRGGFGLERVYVVLSDCTLTVSFDRTECSPWGLEGGQPGQTGYVEILRHGNETAQKILKGMEQVKNGDRVRIVTGGGGGFGPAGDRDLESVRRDLDNGLISAKSALRDYGFAIPVSINRRSEEQR